MGDYIITLVPPSLLSLVLFGNTAAQYLAALILFVLSWIALKIIARIVLTYFRALARRTKTDLDDTLIAIVASLKPPFYFFLSLFFALRSLALPSHAENVLRLLLISVLTYQGVRALGILIDYAANAWGGDDDASHARAALALMGNIAKTALWVIGALLVLSNIGVNITSLIAGLGIGGIAIALALQNILGDLFSSFAIYFDKPFVPGDFIIVGEHKGTVEKIGIKTTRLRSLQGEEIVISNRELTSTRIQNFKKMQERRKVFTIGVEYGTPLEKLAIIPALLRDSINGIDGTRFDRAHLHKFGDSSLLFETAYRVLSPEYSVFMDIHEKIHFEIIKKFAAHDIQFAFPSRTVYLHGQP